MKLIQFSSNERSQTDGFQRTLAGKIANPALRYNLSVAAEGPKVLDGMEAIVSKFLFHDYRFGLPATRKSCNTAVIEIGGRKMTHDEAVISIDSLPKDMVTIAEPTVSRRDAAIVTMGNEGWI